MMFIFLSPFPRTSRRNPLSVCIVVLYKQRSPSSSTLSGPRPFRLSRRGFPLPARSQTTLAPTNPQERGRSGSDDSWSGGPLVRVRRTVITNISPWVYERRRGRFFSRCLPFSFSCVVRGAVHLNSCSVGTCVQGRVVPRAPGPRPRRPFRSARHPPTPPDRTHGHEGRDPGLAPCEGMARGPRLRARVPRA